MQINILKSVNLFDLIVLLSFSKARN